jgi:hypothetical protein
VRGAQDWAAPLGWYAWRSALADGAAQWYATGPWVDDPVLVADSPVELLQLFALAPGREETRLPVPLLEQLF